LNSRLLFLLLFLFFKNSYSQKDTTEIVFYGGKKIFYYPEKELVILLDSAFVRYSFYEVLACSIVYDLKNQLLQAYQKGRPVIFLTERETIVGEELHFNVNSKKGMMKKANTKIAKGFFYADELWLIREKVLHAINCHYTTCELRSPHYHFFAKKVKILIDDLAIVEPISLHFFSFKPPTIVAPFWFFPIGEKRKSGLLPFRAGRSKEEGFYFKRVAYYLVINDHADLTFYLDLMQKKGIMPRIEGIYNYLPLAFGKFQGAFIKEGKRNRYSFTLQHQSKFFFKTDLNSKIDYQSDAQFIQDYAEEKIEWLRNEIYSTINIKKIYKNFGQASINLENQKDFANNIETFLLPSCFFGLVSRPLIKNVVNFSPSIKFDNRYQILKDTIKNYEQKISGNLGLSFSPRIIKNFSFGNNLTYQKRKELIKNNVKEDYSIFKINNNFAFYQSFFNTLNISENINYFEEFKFFKDSTKITAAYPLAINCGITLYRIFLFPFFSLKGFLHTFNPNISLHYEPTVKNNKPVFKERPTVLSLSFNVQNSFNIKYLKKEEEIKRDFLILNLSSSYDFLKAKLSPIAMNGDIRIFEEKNLFLSSSFSFLYNSEEKLWDYSFTNSLSGQWGIWKTCSLAINIAHNLSKNFQMFQVFGFINFSKIKINYGFGYNAKEKRLTDYSISFWKDLHCWEGLFNFSQFGSVWRYDFKLRIKEIPEVALGKDIFGFLLK
jgi:lipopolysaccharide assembly outer membrane protein LptD (OstA)